MADQNKPPKDRPWPKDGTPVRFDAIYGPLRKAFTDLYDFTKKADECDWTGLDLGDRELAGLFSPSTRLTKSQLDYDENEQDRDALDVLLGIAIQLGVEQGRRCAYAEDSMLYTMRQVFTEKVYGRDAGEGE